jgi:hypothetical protein
MAISRGRQTLHFLGHLWLQSLKRAIWIVVIGVAISGIRLALSQSGNGGDMMSEDMENSSNMSMPGVRCPTDVACRELPPRCLNCSYGESCTYGKDTEAMCAPLEGVECEVNRSKIKLCRWDLVVSFSCIECDPGRGNCPVCSTENLGRGG